MVPPIYTIYTSSLLRVSRHVSEWGLRNQLSLLWDQIALAQAQSAHTQTLRAEEMFIQSFMENIQR